MMEIVFLMPVAAILILLIWFYTSIVTIKSRLTDLHDEVIELGESLQRIEKAIRRE
jgi:divalent metal cation (Fe/Co/Zn/Cd) transporter